MAVGAPIVPVWSFLARNSGVTAMRAISYAIGMRFMRHRYAAHHGIFPCSQMPKHTTAENTQQAVMTPAVVMNPRVKSLGVITTGSG